MEIVIAEKSPALSYGIAVSVKDQIFIHGGISIRTTDTSPPSNSCHIFDCTKQTWQNLTGPNVPALSFHAAFVSSDRFVHLVGGWNGKSRSSCVYIYDTQQSTWLPTCKTIGFPNGAGLSGHAITPTKNGGCLITGRLGGLQTQRRSGCVLTLEPLAFPNVYRYDIVSTSDIQSRSGHTCTPIRDSKSNSCLLLGGRDQDVVEILKYDRLSMNDQSPIPVEISDENGRRYHRTPLEKPPSRRYHISIPVNDKYGVEQGVLMHGGENFASTAKGPSKQGPNTVILSTKPEKQNQIKFDHAANRKSPSIYALEECEQSMPRLTGHRQVRINEKIFILGGFGDQWQLNKNLYELKL